MRDTGPHQASFSQVDKLHSSTQRKELDEF
jgi:hypothetical protein